MPDALSKTIPIWIAVLNEALYPKQDGSDHLETPEDVVSRSEHSQIQARLPAFVKDLKHLELNLDHLRSKLAGKALRPIWVTPDSALPSTSTQHDHENYHLVVLCTASGRIASSNGSAAAPANYVQGAADDCESWACGLTPMMFWTNQQRLLSTSENDLPHLIQKLVHERDTSTSEVMSPVAIKSTTLSIANNAAADVMYSDFDIVVSCCIAPSQILLDKLPKHYIHLSCTTGKIGSRQLRSQLPKLEHLRTILTASSKILVTCPTSRDLAVGVALAIICLFCHDDGSLEPSGTQAVQGKSMVKKRLSWITTSIPDASPSRATLQSVNAFLLGSEAPQKPSTAQKQS